MADELDTSTAPDAGQPAEPTTEPEPQATQLEVTPEPEPPKAEPEPPPINQEEIIRQAEERAFQRMASWQGRRDKDLFDNLGNLIDNKIRNIPQAAPPAPEPTDPAQFLENPDRYLERAVPKILKQTVEKLSREEQTFNTELIRHAAARMDADPLFKDQELGNAVVGEIQKNFSSINRNLPPDVAAQLLVSDAVTNIVRQKQTKKNAFEGRTPSAAPMGTVTPPAPQPKKAKPPKLSDAAAALAKRWHYNSEDIARVFGEQ